MVYYDKLSGRALKDALDVASAAAAGTTFPYPAPNGSLMYKTWNRNPVPIGNACHMRLTRLPIGGQTVRARMIYMTPSGVAGYEVNSQAIGSGRLWSETEPKDAAGNPIVWRSNLTPFTTAAGPSGAQDTVESYSPWVTLDVLRDPTYPEWGGLAFRTKNTTGGTGRGWGFVNSNGKLNLVNPVSAPYQDLYVFAASNTTVNSNTFTLTSDPDPATDNRNLSAFEFEIELLSGCYSVVLAADSRGQGDRTAGNLFSWAPRSIEKLQVSGVQIGYESLCLSGSNHATFTAMMMDRLNKTGRRLPSAAMLQVGSSNNTNPWTADTIAADMSRVRDFIGLCRRLGVTPVIVLMYPSITATTSDQVAMWRLLQETALALGVVCVDFYNSSTFTTGGASPKLPTDRGINGDDSHLNDNGANIAANELGVPALKQALNLTIRG